MSSDQLLNIFQKKKIHRFLFFSAGGKRRTPVSCLKNNFNLSVYAHIHKLKTGHIQSLSLSVWVRGWTGAGSSPHHALQAHKFQGMAMNHVRGHVRVCFMLLLMGSSWGGVMLQPKRVSNLPRVTDLQQKASFMPKSDLLKWFLSLFSSSYYVRFIMSSSL